jgi:hypothetical protein
LDVGVRGVYTPAHVCRGVTADAEGGRLQTVMKVCSVTRAYCPSVGDGEGQQVVDGEGLPATSNLEDYLLYQHKLPLPRVH